MNILSPCFRCGRCRYHCIRKSCEGSLQYDGFNSPFLQDWRNNHCKRHNQLFLVRGFLLPCRLSSKSFLYHTSEMVVSDCNSQYMYSKQVTKRAAGCEVSGAPNLARAASKIASSQTLFGCHAIPFVMSPKSVCVEGYIYR